MEVGEMRDPEAVELGREARHPQLERAKARPRRFEETPREPAPDEPSDRSKAVVQTSSFSSAGRGSTTCRLNFSSESASPAATPTSCARCNTGRLNVRPV